MANNHLKKAKGNSYGIEINKTEAYKALIESPVSGPKGVYKALAETLYNSLDAIVH